MAEAGKGATVAKAVKLLELAYQKFSEGDELLAEARALLEGQPGIGDKLKAVERAFDAAWCARYAPGQHGRYVWQYVKDRPQMKRLLKSLTVEQLEERMLNYIRDEDAFYIKARHSFGLFVSSINRWASEGDAPAEMQLEPGARPFACVHVPACKSDAEHTARRNRELRELA